MRVPVWGRRRSHLEGCDGQALEREVLGVYGAVLERGGGRNDQHILMPHAEAAVLVVPGLVRQRHPRTKRDLVRRLPIPCAADAADACVCACVRMRVCAWARMQVRACACARARACVCVCVAVTARSRRGRARACKSGCRRGAHAVHAGATMARVDVGTRDAFAGSAARGQAKPSRAKRGGGGAAAALLSLTSRSKLIPCGPSCTFRNAPTPCPVPAASTARPRAHADPCARHHHAAGRSAGAARSRRAPPGAHSAALRGVCFVCGARGGARAGFRAFGCGPQRTYRAGSRARPATAACARRRRAGSPSCPRGRPPCRRRCARAARASSTAAPATPASHARRQRAPSRRQAPLWMRPRSARRRAALPFPLLRPAPARSHIYLYEYIYIHPLQGCGLPARRGRRGGPILPIHRRTGCGGADAHVLRRLAEVHRARDVGRDVDVLRARVDEVPTGVPRRTPGAAGAGPPSRPPARTRDPPPTAALRRAAAEQWRWAARPLRSARRPCSVGRRRSQARACAGDACRQACRTCGAGRASPQSKRTACSG